MQCIFIIRSQFQRGSVGFNRTGVITALVARIAQVIKCICLDLFTLNTGKGLGGIRIVTRAVECDAATVVIRKFIGRVTVFTLFKFLHRLLLRVLEPGRIDGICTEQAAKQQC